MALGGRAGAGTRSRAHGRRRGASRQRRRPAAGRRSRRWSTWCQHGDRPLWLIEGAAGAGKTRLADEVADRLTRQRWPCGWARPGMGAYAVTAAARNGRRALVLVDDAETRADLFELLRTVANGGTPLSVRVIIVAREFGAWWSDCWPGSARPSRRRSPPAARSWAAAASPRPSPQRAGAARRWTSATAPKGQAVAMLATADPVSAGGAAAPGRARGGAVHPGRPARPGRGPGRPAGPVRGGGGLLAARRRRGDRARSADAGAALGAGHRGGGRHRRARRRGDRAAPGAGARGRRGRPAGPARRLVARPLRQGRRRRRRRRRGCPPGSPTGCPTAPTAPASRGPWPRSTPSAGPPRRWPSSRCDAHRDVWPQRTARPTGRARRAATDAAAAHASLRRAVNAAAPVDEALAWLTQELELDRDDLEALGEAISYPTRSLAPDRDRAGPPAARRAPTPTRTGPRLLLSLGARYSELGRWREARRHTELAVADTAGSWPSYDRDRYLPDLAAAVSNLGLLPGPARRPGRGADTQLRGGRPAPGAAGDRPRPVPARRWPGR